MLSFARAKRILESYNPLPEDLRPAAVMLLVGEAFGVREVEQRLICRMVAKHESRRNATEPPQDVIRPQRDHERPNYEIGAKDVARLREYVTIDPNTGRALFYWPETRGFYRSPKVILELLHRAGWTQYAPWHVKAAFQNGRALPPN